MSRLTISLPDTLHNRILSLAIQHEDSMSHMINQLIHVGLQHWYEKQSNQVIEQHCQQLIIQMNALIKNISVELLKFSQDDFDKLQKAVIGKFNELTN